MTTARRRLVRAVAGAVMVTAAGCMSSGDGTVSPTSGSTSGSAAAPLGDPAADRASADDRAVSIRTTGCGDASGTSGSGVIVAPAIVLTAAHVVAGATDVFIDGSDEPATVFALDRTRDLALMKHRSFVAESIELADVAAGDAVRVVGGATSGTVDATIVRLLRMDVDDVRSTTRSTRSGFELDSAIEGGDSGAGVFDADDQLTGIVFAVPSERSAATYAVDATEVAAVLAASDGGEYRCDPAQSRLVGPAGT